MKKYRGYLLVLLIAFCIQGCSKQQDVEDHRFVLAMGFSFRVDKLARLALIRFCAKNITELARRLDPPLGFAKSTDF